MKFIEPSAELWCQSNEETGTLDHVARCARVCYKIENPKRPAESLCQMLIERKHMSMFRHATYYIKLDIRTEYLTVKMLCKHNFIQYAHIRKRNIYLFAINGQTWLELGEGLQRHLYEHIITEADIAQMAENLPKEKAFEVLGLIRTTVCVTTQISTTRELNRVSPNNIAEQSTRYVNFGKKGGVSICKPWWYDKSKWYVRLMAHVGWKISEWFYNLALQFNLHPENAREFLPLSAGTQAVYTYSGSEWRHIMDLRLRETTGPAHPNAKRIAEMIQREVNVKMKMYSREYSI